MRSFVVSANVIEKAVMTIAWTDEILSGGSMAIPIWFLCTCITKDAGIEFFIRGGTIVIVIWVVCSFIVEDRRVSSHRLPRYGAISVHTCAINTVAVSIL